MISRRRYIILISLVIVLFAFRQADEYFEISKNLEIFSSVYKTIHNDYVDEVKPGELMKTGIDAMLASLDPYTNFYTESQAEDAMIRQSGEYGGIGCRSIRIGDYICITHITKGLPADKAGMRIGDRITEINGRSFIGRTDDEAGEALKGAPGSKVSVTVDRQGRQIPLEITREDIKIRNVTWYGLINPSTGYIRLDHFTMGAGQEVKDALLSMKAKGIKSLILDLRDNGGGLLHEAVRIVNIFVPVNEMVVVAKGRSKEFYQEYKTLDPAVDKDIPLVVLVNERSASASEIVSGAIQDLDRGVVIGRNTFGKGLVQNVRPLVYRTQMKVTIAKYYIPSGRCIQQLDYSNRNAEGKAGTTADSLRKKFRTRNGRTVLDAGGIRPDIITELPQVSNIASVLEKSRLIFDFAGKFREDNGSIPDISGFRISDEIFESFRNYISGKEFSHLTESEKTLKQLKEKLKQDKFGDALEADVLRMEKAVEKAKLAQMDAGRQEIERMLQTEIGRRYYYDDAVFISSFAWDPDILGSLSVLSDKTRYDQILNRK